jgi:hypothetical protein
VLALGDVVDADMNFSSARHAAGELFAQEKIGQASQFLRAFNRVVVGESEKVHAAAPQHLIHFERIAVTFAAKSGKERGGASTGEVHIASHGGKYESCRLRACDSGAKLLKTQGLNRLDTRNILLTKL